MTGAPEWKDISCEQASKHVSYLLVVTAVPPEREALISRMRPLDGQTRLLRCHWEQDTYFIGYVGRSACVLVMCGQTGSIGRDAAITTVARAIRRWSPTAVLMPGIAFGKSSKRQQMGDVLVSTQVIAYERQRIGTAVQYRGERPAAGQTLLNRFQNAMAGDVHGIRHQFGPLLSGEKLVDDPHYKDALFEQFPDAIGGEMEGIGVYSAAEDAKREWIVVKAICDWGEQKDNPSKERDQAAAADNAANLLEVVLAAPGLHPEQFRRGDTNMRRPVTLALVLAVGMACAVALLAIHWSFGLGEAPGRVDVVASQGQTGGQIAHTIINNGLPSRPLSASVRSEMIQRLRPLAPSCIAFASTQGDVEADEFKSKLIEVFLAAGWDARDQRTFMFLENQRGVVITIPRGSPETGTPQVVADALALTGNQIGANHGDMADGCGIYVQVWSASR